MDAHLLTVDDVLVRRAASGNQSPLVGFPSSNLDGKDGEYEIFNAKQLDVLVDGTTRVLRQLELQMPKDLDKIVVALFGISSLDYLITMLALSRMGFTVLILSPRLSVEALLSLLADARCFIIFSDAKLSFIVQKIQQDLQITNYYLPQQLNHQITNFDYHHRPSDQLREPSQRLSDVAYILHSSGSTSTPKLIAITHQAGLGTFEASANDERALCTVPLYHMHGHSTLYRTFFGGGSIFFLDPNRAITTSTLLSAMENIHPNVVFTVPYTLKMLSESSKGVEMMKSCKMISVSGSQCPDELGNRLVSQGVHLVSFFGSTETGGIMSSARPKEDKAWNYLRLPPQSKPFLYMKKLDSKTYELVVLDGFKSKVISNSNDPPNSFHSRDIFSPHPTIPDAWKYLGRLDDRVTLLSGEKVLPLPIEGCIRQHPYVKEAIVFGIGRTVPGLLLFKNEVSQILSDDEFISHVWPTINRANSSAESFSQITREMIIVLQPHVDYPRTDKGTFIRAKAYSAFENVIEASYDTGIKNSAVRKLRLGKDEISSHLLDILRSNFSLDVKDQTTDLFASGLDSLLAIRLAKLIVNELYLGESPPNIDQNTVYEQGNVQRLSAYLYCAQSGLAHELELNQEETINELISSYSRFKSHIPCSKLESENTVLLTGATGSLGSHILALLLDREDIDRVYCTMRDKFAEAGKERIKGVLQAIRPKIQDSSLAKIVIFPANMSEETLGMMPETFEHLQNSLSLIVHCAWAVNFNVGVRGFEDQHIKGTQNLINLSLSVKLPRPARFVFCSSISVASGLSSETQVPEDTLEISNHLPTTGYGQSKLVAEHIVSNAKAKGADCLVLRIGQIVGDSIYGAWNTSEAVPLLLRTANSLNCLPELDETCSWLPVDFAARIVLELSDHANIQRVSPVYNVLNPVAFHWTRDLLPALRDSGLTFDTVRTQEWLQRLQNSEQNPLINPSVKLLSFWEHSLSAADHSKKQKFVTDIAESASVTLRNVPGLIENGYIRRFVKSWQRQWHG